MHTDLELPRRCSKPRTSGLTMVIDAGLPLGLFRDVVASHAELIDLVKFGWGTAVVSPTLDAKIATLQQHGVGFFFGGTLLEKHVAQGRFAEYVRLLRDQECRYVEVSDGTLPMRPGEKASYIGSLADEFTVLAEVGFKQPDRNETLTPADWASAARADLDAGATLVITEAREAGNTGMADASGRCRDDVLDAILGSGIGAEQLLFEAPTKQLQTHLVTRLGPNVNLGNIAPLDVIGVETLRLGLRSDTFAAFEPLAMMQSALTEVA
ncbi:MAG TPA: phosphosulfolactate synthase [Mycobacteriales bacterium]